MAASRVGLLYSSTQTNTTNSTTIAAATSNTVASGNTAWIAASARGATAGTATISGLPGDAVAETPLNRTQAASPAVELWRVYFPSGMSSGTTITITWDSSNSRKTLQGVVWTGVANANAQASAGANGTSTPPNPTSGTTGATTTTTGVHVFACGSNATSGTITGTAGSDEEGAMTEEADTVVGASTFHYLYLSTRAVTAAHAGGMTAGYTPSAALASWAGVQGVWDGATAVVRPPVFQGPKRPRSYNRPTGPQIGWR